MVRALAYYHGPSRIRRMADAFMTGCRRHGIECNIRQVGGKSEAADLVWLYGLGPARPVFDQCPNARRLVGDKGYFHEHGPDGYIRVSVDAQQPDKHLRLRKHEVSRWTRLGITQDPVKGRGDYVLICGMGPKQAVRQGLAYGQWERETYAKVCSITDRPILIREKPKNGPIKGLPRSEHQTTSEAIRGAWAVVCLTGNIGVDAIVEGVPVFAEAGPGSVYYPQGLSRLESVKPLSESERLEALADICHWQWTLDEFRSGEFLAHLKLEGMI